MKGFMDAQRKKVRNFFCVEFHRENCCFLPKQWLTFHARFSQILQAATIASGKSVEQRMLQEGLNIERRRYENGSS